MRLEARQSLILLMGTVVTAGLGLIFSIVTQNWLGNDLAADFVAAMAIVTAGQLAFGPLNGAVARLTALHWGAGRPWLVLPTVVRLRRRTLVAIGVGLLPGFICVPWLAGVLNIQRWTLIGLSLLGISVTLLLSIERGVLRGLQAFGTLSWNGVIEASTRALLGLSLLVLMLDPISGVGGYVLGAVGAWGLAHWSIRTRLAGLEPDGGGAESAASSTSGDRGRSDSLLLLPMLVTMLVSAGFQHVDIFAANTLLPSFDAGVYGAAFTLGKLISALVTPFTTLLLPALASRHGAGQSLWGPFARVTTLFVLVSGVPLVVLAVWSTSVFSVLFKPSFGDGADFLFRIALARWFGFGGYFVAVAGMARGHFAFLWAYVPLLILQVVLLGFADASGLGIATMTLVGHVVSFVVLMFFLPAILRSDHSSDGVDAV
ncbi:MAG: lipopolysaccharide biosynthesis protein [Phycisphaerae bacterium]